MALLQNNFAARVAAKINPQLRGKIKLLSNRLLWHLAAPLAFALIVIFFFPSRGRFEFSTDEGINLMKSMLVQQGHPLYGEIWSDQPPLFTYLLSGVFYVFGLKVGAGRFLVLFLSCVLLWAAFQFMILAWGKKPAIAGALLIMQLPKYLTLSVSVMVGLPALAFAMLSLLALALWHRRRNSLFLVLSALALGLSVLTKLFTGFLAPIFILGIAVDGYARLQKGGSWRGLLAPVALWGTVFAAFTLVSGVLLVGPGNVPQILDTHLAGAQATVLSEQIYFTINYHLQEGWPVLLLALVGTLFSLRNRSWLSLYPLGWSAAAYLLLSFHRPVWFHHQLLVTIPAAMLGGVALYEAARWVVQIVRPYLDTSASGLLRAAALAGLLALVFTFRVTESISLLRPFPSLSISGLELGPLTERFLVRMIKYAPETHWVVTDLPMYAFRARLPVPPNLVVFSVKRFETGNLTEEEVIDTIREYHPEQILLGRYDYPRVAAFLAGRYYLIHSKELMKLYIRNDLAGVKSIDPDLTPESSGE
jgi:4-amino-4-deoxy-L-arabinose transferase-like glycosyltransferase